MSISFTDLQIKELSLTTLQLPLIIDNPSEGTGLVQKREAFITERDDLFALDEQNKIFSDFWITVLLSYHLELERLNKTVKSAYSEALLVAGAQGLPDHYVPDWPNVVPIVIPANTGLPTSTSGTESEVERIAALNFAIDRLVNGFGGSTTDALDSNYTAGDGNIELVSGSLTPGDFIIIDSGGSSMFALVGAGGGFCTGDIPPGATDEPTCTGNGGTWTATTSITPISTDKNFSSGARVRNFHAGFTNAERGHQGAPNYAFDVMEYFESEIDSNTLGWESNLTDQLSATSGNEDILPANIPLLAQAVADVTAVLADIDTWQASPIIDASGRFTDATLPLLQTNTALRTTQSANRITEVGTSLGTLVQAGDGSVTGSGAYASLYEFVSIRIAKSGGTLYGWYNALLAIVHFDTKIANATAQETQFNNSFAIATIIADTVVSQIAFEVDSVVEFSNGQTVKVMDNDSIVHTRTIAGISGSIITLDSGIASVLTTSSIARIVRVK